jgi:hypothetical protein
MRLLFVLAHYFHAQSHARHASQKDPAPRVRALRTAIARLHQHFGPSQCMIDLAPRTARWVNSSLTHHIDVVVCTTGQDHLLGEIDLPGHFYRHLSTQAQPLFLGFECQRVLAQALGQYDYYAYLEDDLSITDPWFFAKQCWFNRLAGDGALLQPNRFETSVHGAVRKAYIDGDITAQTAAQFHDVQEQECLTGEHLGQTIVLRRMLNPHAGCYFLNARQMAFWAAKPEFAQPSTAFIGPLESAATLGITRHFRVYKPAPENAAFLEIEHPGIAFLGLIGKTVLAPH